MLGFGIVICALFSSVLANPISLTADKTPFTIEEATLNELPVASFSGKWISDSEIEFLDKQTKDVKILNVPKNKTEVVLKGSVLDKYKTTKYSFSPDRKYVLICYDERAVFRHSKTAKYTVYSVKDGNFYDVSKKDNLQIAEWGPKNNTLVYIKGNNIYVILAITNKMEAAQITSNGNPGVIFNGMGDWVYEEEILSSGRAFWFSPNGDQLAFATFFDSNVTRAIITEYGEPGSLKDQYTKQVEVPYPKAGCFNPTFKLRHVRFSDTSKIKVISESIGDEILYDLTWAGNDAVVYLKTNRVQNESKTFACEVKEQGKCQMIFQHNNTVGWANTNLPVINNKVNGVLRIEGLPVEKAGNFKHIMLYYNNGTSYRLTNGYSEVIRVLKWDEERKIIYYLATEPMNSTTTQVYAIKEEKGSAPVCLTCRIKSPEGRGCKEASAAFSKMSSYVIINCNGPDPRMVYLFKNVQPLGTPLAVLEDNEKLRIRLSKKLMPTIMNLSIKSPVMYATADVRLFLPPKMDTSGKTKYPLVIYVYGGPNSKNINDAFKIDWGYYLTTNLSVIYGLIDGRNTMRKGENMLFAGYRALGTYEMEDQINITKTLQATLPFIDPKRTGIWGWSYGGYATTKILELDTKNVFKCGVAVAPVADWIYYDSMYTERYMGYPVENEKGYAKSSVLKDVSNLRNKKYFLIHGNADDNVHYQNAMMIAKLLERNNIPFQLMSYPDEDHSLGNVRKHLYYTMDDFWKNCFNLSR